MRLVKRLKPPNIDGTHWNSVTNRGLLLSKIPLPKNGNQHKWHLTTTLLVFWSTTNTLLIWIVEPTPTTIRNRRVPRISFCSGKISTLKPQDLESERVANSPKLCYTESKCTVTRVVMRWTYGNSLDYSLSMFLEFGNMW